MWDVVLGLVAIALGLLLVFAGLRYFIMALPILGFFFGFLAGGAGVQAILGDGIFSTLTSWLVGLILGLIFAFISYFWWYAGALIAAGSTGALLGTAIVRIFTQADWLILIFAIIGFIVGFVVALMLALPVYIVLVNTAFTGATVVVTGLLLVIDRADRSDLGYGNIIATINDSWWWTIPVAALAIAGIFSQIKNLSQVALPDDRWTTASAV